MYSGGHSVSSSGSKGDCGVPLAVVCEVNITHSATVTLWA
jgi:hypothetical protein